MLFRSPFLSLSLLLSFCNSFLLSFSLHVSRSLSLVLHTPLFPFSIGGSIPIVFSYYSEFLAQEKRGEHLSWLCMFWMIGGIYASAMAWAIIPHYGEYITCTGWPVHMAFSQSETYTLENHVTEVCTVQNLETALWFSVDNHEVETVIA